MTDEKDDYTISYYVSQHFGILIGETWTLLNFHTRKIKPLKYDQFIISLGEISQKEKN